ncbi:hypothetical protein M758_2G217400 [Ceratodon purpureus]|nr:hypothetical protein M758_2G217400 [Ceratodon purpureus]
MPLLCFMVFMFVTVLVDREPLIHPLISRPIVNYRFELGLLRTLAIVCSSYTHMMWSHSKSP